jgi:hypothetical protein
MFGGNFSRIAYHFKQRYHWNVVTRNKQYGHHHLYLHPQYRSVCHYHNLDHYGESAGDANVYRSSADMFGSDITRIANHFKQRYHRNVVTRTKQHGHDHLYLHPQYRSVCDHHDFDHYGESAGDAYLYRSSTHLFGGNFSRITYDFKQRYHRNVGTRTKQHGYNDLYLHPQYRSVCNHHDLDHYGESPGDAYLYRSSADMFGSDFSRITDNFK